MGVTTASDAKRILHFLELEAVAIIDDLVLITNKLRAAQQQQLLQLLARFHDASRVHLIQLFDRALDIRQALDDWLQDLIKIHQYVKHHGVDDPLAMRMIEVYGCLEHRGDRVLLTKGFQTIGFALCGTLCSVLERLPFKLRREFLGLFEEQLPDLKVWIEWMASVARQTRRASRSVSFSDVVTSPIKGPVETILTFLTKILQERTALLWLQLLKPVADATRLAIIQSLSDLPPSTVKLLGRFLDTSGTSVQKILDLDPGFLQTLTLFLAEVPPASLITLIHKFNDAALVRTIQNALEMPDHITKRELLNLIDALANADPIKLKKLVLALFRHDKKEDLVRLFLSLSSLHQLKFLDLVHEDENEDAPLILELFLHAHFTSYELAIQKLAALSMSSLKALLRAMAQYLPDELQELGSGLEAIDPICLPSFLAIFEHLPSDLRAVFVDHVRSMPGPECLTIYKVLQILEARQKKNDVVNLVQLLARLKLKYKAMLCTKVLGNGPEDGQDDRNLRLLLYLSEATLSETKVIRLLAVTPWTNYDQLLFLLRTQAPPEQVALTRLLLSLSSAANCRVLDKMARLETDHLDEFFQILLLTPKAEYKMLARLLVAPDVSVDQFQNLVRLAANLMNQASTRELVTFTAELPSAEREMLFKMLAEPHVIKGVILRMVACASKMSRETMWQLVRVLHALTWEARSSLVEQVRALEDERLIDEFILYLKELPSAVQVAQLVHLFNLLQLSVRIAMVPLLASLSLVQQVDLLEKLDGMPKDQSPTYCAVLCGLGVRAVATEFMQVLGLTDTGFQSLALAKLQQEHCWYFFRTLAAQTAHPSKRDPAVINGLLATLALLDTPSEYQLLQFVMEHAMANGLRLDELVLVLAQFRPKDQLIAFLHYAQAFTKSTMAPLLLFRVLCKYKQTAFLYEMCCLLDTDDAVFALKRLDRLSASANADFLQAELARLATTCTNDPVRRGFVKDAFCNLILGFKETEPRLPVMHQPPPLRSQTTEEVTTNVPTETTATGLSPQASTATAEPTADTETLAAVAPLSLRPVRVQSHIHRLETMEERRRRRQKQRNKWRIWITTKTPEPHRPVNVDDQVDNPTEYEPDPVEAPSEAPSDPPADPIEHDDQSLARMESVPADLDLAPPQTILPPVYSRSESSRQRFLARSESAPEPFQTRPRRSIAPEPTDPMDPFPLEGKARRCRGLVRALELPEEVHVRRDRGVGIFQKACEVAHAQSPSRIRFAKTPHAKAAMLELRAQKALGRKLPTQEAPVVPFLCRNDRQIIEKAQEALMAAAQLREHAPDALNPTKKLVLLPHQRIE